MTVSTFKLQRLASLDSVPVPAATGPDLFRVGALIAGGGKTANRMQLLTADLAAVADEGPPVPRNAIVTLAELWGNVTAVLGTSVNYNVRPLARDRSIYNHNNATWQIYDTTNKTWRVSQGRDFDGTSIVQFLTPVTGDQAIVAITAFVADAIANRAGPLQLHIALDIPTPLSSEHVTVRSTPTTAADVGRIVVSWDAPLTTPIDHPEGVTLPERPPRSGGATSARGWRAISHAARAAITREKRIRP